MIEYLVGMLVAGVLLLLPLAYKRAARWWRRRQRIYDECWCGKTLNKKTDHRVVEVQDDRNLVDTDDKGKVSFRVSRGEGTAMVADFCSEHCPGGCQWKCDHREVKLPSRRQDDIVSS